MKKWMGLFLAVMLVMTSVVALADSPFFGRGGHGPYNAGILPEVKDALINQNKEYQETFNKIYAADVAEAAAALTPVGFAGAAGISAANKVMLTEGFEVNRCNMGTWLQEMFNKKSTDWGYTQDYVKEFIFAEN